MRSMSGPILRSGDKVVPHEMNSNRALNSGNKLAIETLLSLVAVCYGMV